MLTSPTHQSWDRPLQLGLLGFTPLERALVANICKLTQVRTQKGHDARCRFEIADVMSNQPLDILLIDADTLDMAQVQPLTQSRQPDATQLLIGKTLPTGHEPGHYTLPRSRLGGLLLRQLDKIAAARVEHPTAPETIPQRCLVIDDSQLVRAQMELILNEYNATAEFAEDAESGLRMAQNKPYDFIFLDVMLPGMDGYQACKRLKADPQTQTIPVVMLTSKKSPFNKMHGALVGCNKYLTKPIDPDQVKDVLQRYGSAGSVAGIGELCLLPA